MDESRWPLRRRLWSQSINIRVNMSLLSWMALVATIACSTAGNTLANWSHSFAGRKRLLVLLSAIGIHGFGLICFSIALAGIPLAIAYPLLIGGTVAAVCLLAATLFGERLSRRHLAGLALIIVGMVLLQGSSAVPDQSASAWPAAAGDDVR